MSGGISGRTKKRALRLVLATLGALVLGAGAAWAGGGSTVLAEDNAYVSEAYTIDEGQLLGFTNQGSNTHTVTADANGPDKGPLFRSPRLGGGDGPVPVPGTQFLSEGEYPFHCEIHPSQMRALLTVANSPAGPQPRPRIKLKVKSKQLEKVVDSEKLKVEVASKSPTDADNVSLNARKGNKKIAKGKLDVGGNRDVEKLKLTGKGENALEDLDQAKVKVEGTVDFGFGDKAKKKLK